MSSPSFFFTCRLCDKSLSLKSISDIFSSSSYSLKIHYIRYWYLMNYEVRLTFPPEANNGTPCLRTRLMSNFSKFKWIWFQKSTSSTLLLFTLISFFSSLSSSTTYDKHKTNSHIPDFGFITGTFEHIESIAWPAATRVSHVLLLNRTKT